MTTATARKAADVTLQIIDSDSSTTCSDAYLEEAPREPQFIQADEKISLTDEERQIFQILVQCVQDTGMKVVLRVAGGWVRDKLLGNDCNDLDIAIDRMAGEPFASALWSYLQTAHIQSSAYGVIQSNPDRSKHLETATLRILGRSIDFVNLRAEQYAQHSRIPSTVTFGTPLEDARRRDCTINALFYNLHNRQIEDWTGWGLEDLRFGIIRTPLCPRVTLLDDPLRLLRAIRFATRFGYRMVPGLHAAIQDPVVHDAFAAKVSRERVGIEMEKIIKGPCGFTGLELLASLNCFHLVYPSRDLQIDYGRLIAIARGQKESLQPRRLAYLALGLIPHLSAMSNQTEMLEGMLRDSLKLSNRDTSDIRSIVCGIEQINEELEEVQTNPIRLGRLVYGIGQYWRLSFALARCHAEYMMQGENLCKYKKLEAEIEEKGLGECWSWKTILTGRDLQTECGVKQGPQIGAILQQVLDHQFANPSLSRSEAIRLVQVKNGSFE